MAIESIIFLNNPEEDFYIKNSYFLHDWVTLNGSLLKQNADEIEYSISRIELLSLVETIEKVQRHLIRLFDILIYKEFDSIIDFEEEREDSIGQCSTIAGVSIRDNIDIDFYNKISHIKNMLEELINKSDKNLIYTYRCTI